MALFPSRCSRPRGGISSPNTPWAVGTGTQSPILCRARAGARWDRAGSAWWGRSTRGSPAPRLLAQHPIIARLLKDVAVSRRLLMPPHGNWEPGDFHHLTQKQKGTFLSSPRAQPRMQQQGHGCAGSAPGAGMLFLLGGRAVSQQS